MIDVETVLLAPHFPVDVADVVAGRIILVLGKFNAGTLMGTSVMTREQALDQLDSPDAEEGNLRQGFWTVTELCVFCHWGSPDDLLTSGTLCCFPDRTSSQECIGRPEPERGGLTGEAETGYRFIRLRLIEDVSNITS